ncbi:MAG: rod shape-determining protein RodA [Candidatus Buchananbacteria bacterium RIFCSPHIGHO2_02_FULL_38_8]|uniref:Rod shape-determining protein RodA n=1 Tax=Candidatus Buchananbacteria bacterium RIFCSPHIGHO2_02_FULL_38_8 TaxID=1797538 RepID=A0A1G1Y6T4_9BACT|nr:hypothetical protein [uncultured bacterium]OGY47951.1 MAG: rod shape-determining protein RodA [Candidatus Buchananbacteria bacterium RIFCSPHIGHO2_02_FULL_38_8]
MIFRRYSLVLKNFDWLLFSAAVLLVCFGLAALYSITISFDNPDFLNFKKQVIFSLIGLLLLLAVSFIDYRWWRDLAFFVYVFAVILLITVLFIGQIIHGTKGWFNLLGLNFQPVEIAKLALVVMLAGFLSKRITAVEEFKSFIMTGLLAGLPFLLVIFQPDFGSALILFLIWFLLIFLAGTDKKYLIGIIGLIIFMFVVSWFFIFADYQKDRILTFFNPEIDPYGRGYHVRQATIAVGAGGLFGRGLGFGSQSQLKFIPASQTDFIFAVIAEELGFLGVGLVFFFWVVIFQRLIKAVNQVKDDFASLFILGVSILFFIQVFINIGMNVGLVPVTGISLPFVSYGGSFLIISLVLIGLVESIIARSRS